MLRVGLTGGIGSGKSTVCRLFAELGVPIVDTDAIAHQLVSPGQPALKLLCATFGEAILDADGVLDRRALRERVFRDKGELRKLEAILHPLIRQRMQQQLDQLDSPYVILAIPLLLEKGWQGEVDRILVIDTDEALQRSRTMARDQVDEETVKRIMQAQVTHGERLAAADDIIHNDKDIRELAQQVQMLHRKYLTLATAP